jgi:hypothetical protein
MFGFKFVTSRALDYLKAQNRIANEKLRDKEAEIKTLKTKTATETKRGDRFERDLQLHKTHNLNTKDKCKAEIKTLRATVDNLKAELVLYKTAIPNIKDLAIIGTIFVCVLDNSGVSYRKAVSLLGQWWRDYNKPTRS